jgi:betaine-aldehyde dehydrogenase
MTASAEDAASYRAASAEARRWAAGPSDLAFPVIAPATGEQIASYRVASPGEVNDLVTTATEAFTSWRRVLPGERSRLLLTIAQQIEERAEELALLESANVGKPLSAAREDIPITVDVFRFMSGAARVGHAPSAGEFAENSTSFVRREPIGVVALVTPWNYPLVEAAWKVAPALAAGNCVLLKPSEMTPETSIRLADIINNVLPPGAFNLVLGDASTGQAMVEHPGVSLVSLTGDTGTGKKVAASAGATLRGPNKGVGRGGG